MRDPQRKRVYAAEKILEPKQPNLTTRQAQQYANRILRTPTWRELSPNNAGVTIQRLRARAITSMAQSNNLIISLAPMHHNRISITHEMAHILVGRALGSVPDHGPEYVAILARLLKDVRTPRDYVRWVEEIISLGVKWDESRFA